MINIENKKFVYHRALNTQRAFEDFLSKNETSEYELVAEGDICWAFIGGEYVIYVYHPDIHGKSLSDEKIIQMLKSNELFTLEKLLSINSDVNFILELKTGNGEFKGFITAFKEVLERYNAKNVLIDAFSIEQLKLLKEMIPELSTSMHTKFVLGKFVLETTFEKPYVRLHNLYKLDFIDYITISYTTTHTKLLDLDVDKTYADIYRSNKKLNLGSIKSIKSFHKAMESQAEYIYLRSDEVLNNYEKVLKNENN